MPGEKPELNVVAQQPQAPRRRLRSPAAPGHDQGTASLSFYLEAISQGRWLIVGALAVAALGLAWVLATQTPLYEADILLQVDAAAPEQLPDDGSQHRGSALRPPEPGPDRDRGHAVAAPPGSRGGQPPPRRLRVAPVLPQGGRRHRAPPRQAGARHRRARPGQVRLGWRAGQGHPVRRPGQHGGRLALLHPRPEEPRDLRTDRRRRQGRRRGEGGQAAHLEHAHSVRRRARHRLRPGARRPAGHRVPPAQGLPGPGGQGTGQLPQVRREGEVHRPHPGLDDERLAPVRRRGPQLLRPRLPAPQRGEALRRGRDARSSSWTPRSRCCATTWRPPRRRSSATRSRRAPQGWTSRSPPPPRWSSRSTSRSGSRRWSCSARSCSSGSPGLTRSSRR